MARKMYREAVEVYKEGPLDSAVIWNKIGIAYHQMLQIDEARKNYEKAIKLNPSVLRSHQQPGHRLLRQKSFGKRFRITSAR